MDEVLIPSAAPIKDDAECWQQFGAVARRLVKRLGLPPATGIQVLERAGVLFEAAE